MDGVWERDKATCTDMGGQGVATGSEECGWVRAWICEEEEMGILGPWTAGHSGEGWGVEYGGHGTIKYNIHRPAGKRGEN